ncbi:hypothetical protein [Halomonas denitrificans]|nr:hypothetical protein [Halomonas denitrificans]
MRNIRIKQLVLFFLLVAPAIGWACSCAVGPLPSRQALLNDYEFVFSGVVIGREVPNQCEGPGCIRSSREPVFYTLRVEHVWQGEVAATVQLRSVIAEASCGVGWSVGERHLVTARRRSDEGRIVVSFCQLGSKDWPATQHIVRLLGEPAESRVDFPPPDHQVLAAHLFSSDRHLRDLALDFWTASRCGRNYLFRIIDRLPLADRERVAVLREILPSVDRLGRPPQNGFDPDEPFVYECPPIQQAWVDTQLGR